MACSCRNKKADAVDIPHTVTPTEPCIFCAEKHFSTALSLIQEVGYESPNRQSIIGEIVLAQWHIYRMDYHLAEDLRDLRHLIQNRRETEVTADMLKKISDKFDVIINMELAKGEKEK